MPKVRTTLTIDADVLKAVKVRAADDYLIALAESQRAVLVSGGAHLLDLSARIPVRSPRDFLDLLTQRR